MKVFNRVLILGVLAPGVPGSFRYLVRFDSLKALVDYVQQMEPSLYLPYANLSVALSRNYVASKKLSLVYVSREQGFLIWAENVR